MSPELQHPIAMMLTSPLFGAFGVLGLALGVCLVLLFVIRAQRLEVRDGVDDLTFRLRRPWQWSAAHPLQAMRRKIAR
jgi:hypothetical protein